MLRSFTRHAAPLIRPTAQAGLRFGAVRSSQATFAPLLSRQKFSTQIARSLLATSSRRQFSASSTAATWRQWIRSQLNSHNFGLFVLFNIGAQCAHMYMPNPRKALEDPIFYGRFTCRADGDKLAEFYEAHDLLEVMMPWPRLYAAIMDTVQWDSDPPTGVVYAATGFGPNGFPATYMVAEEESRCHVPPVNLDVGFEITREEDDDEVITLFVRHERFIIYVPFTKVRFMDWTYKFGFKKLNENEGGVKERTGEMYEVFHKCTELGSFWAIRIPMYIHHCYTVWGCDQVVNNTASFPTQEDDYSDEQYNDHRHQVHNVPYYYFFG